MDGEGVKNALHPFIISTYTLRAVYFIRTHISHDVKLNLVSVFKGLYDPQSQTYATLKAMNVCTRHSYSNLHPLAFGNRRKKPKNQFPLHLLLFSFRLT